MLRATDRVRIAATGNPSVRGGCKYRLLVTLTLPAASYGRRLQGEEEEGRELKPAAGSSSMKKPLNTTDYALLMTVPGGGAVNAAYKHTLVSPGMKPGSLKKPQVHRPRASLPRLLHDRSCLGCILCNFGALVVARGGCTRGCRSLR